MLSRNARKKEQKRRRRRRRSTIKKKKRVRQRGVGGRGGSRGKLNAKARGEVENIPSGIIRHLNSRRNVRSTYI